MSTRLSRIGVFAWLILVWAAFLYFQQQPYLREGPAISYATALIKVLSLLIVAAATGMRLQGGKQGDGGILASLAVGLVLLGLVTFALAAVGAFRPTVIWPVLAALAAVSYRQVGSVIRRAAGVLRAAPGPIETAALCVTALAAVVCLIGSLAPLTANDSLVYHLNLPKIYGSAGGFVRLPHNVYANMPHYGEVLYALFYVAAGEAGAKLFYWFGVLAAGGAVYALARRFTDRRAALIGVSVFLVQPLVIDHRIICNVDVMLAFFYMAALMMGFDLCRKGPGWRRVTALSLTAGFMLGLKYTAVLPFISALVIPLACASGRRRIKHVIVAVGIGLLVFAPWAVKNEIHVGNPVYPMLESTFGGRNWDTVQTAQLMAWQWRMGMGRGIVDYLLLPFNVSLHGKPGMNYKYFDGTLTPLLLILVPLALMRRRRETNILIILAAAGFVFWALTSQQLRFLIPTVALLAVLAAKGFSSLAGRIGDGPAKAIAVLVLLVGVSTLAVSDQYGEPFLSGAFGERLRVVSGLETRQHYLERTLQPYAMFRMLEERLPKDEPVLLIWENRGYYLDRAYVADSFFEASTLMRMAADAGSADRLKLMIRTMGLRYVLVNDLLGEVFTRGYDPKQVATLREFIATHLRPLHSSNRMTLYEIAAD